MNRGFTCSKASAAFAAASMAAAGAMFALRSNLGLRIAEHRVRAASLENDLSIRISARSEYDEANLDSLRSEVGQFRTQLGPPGGWERVAGLFARRWKMEAEPTSEARDFESQSCTFRMISPKVSDWPEIMDTVKEVEAVPGAGIMEIQIQAAGGREHVNLETVRVLVSVRTRRSVTGPSKP